MRILEFEKQMKWNMRQGEISTQICFRKENDSYMPAVLCAVPEFFGQDYVIKDVKGIIYWDNDERSARREDIPYEERQKLKLPVKIGTVISDDQLMAEDAEDETNDDEMNDKEKIAEDEYLIDMEILCCALEAGDVTQEMKDEYRKQMGFDKNKELEVLFKRFFPDAMENLSR